MKYEQWREHDGYTFISSNSRESLTDPKAELLWKTEANSWTEAMMLYHKHMDWEPYKEMYEK